MRKILIRLLMVVGLAVIGSSAVYAESTEMAISSSTVTLNVKSALLASKGIDSNQIKVISTTSPKDSRLAIVTLKGTQKSKKLVKQAGDVARKVEGVGEVRNLLTVSKK